jgi:hypothetical protein
MPKFGCYWNLKIDYLYVEVEYRKMAQAAMEHVKDMRARGLLDAFRNVAFDWSIWETNGGEHWYAILFASFLICSQSLLERMPINLLISITTLRLLPNIKTCAFVFRNTPREVIDVLELGVYWKLVPVTH